MESTKFHDIVGLVQRFYGTELTKGLVQRVKRLRAAESASFWDLHNELEGESLTSSGPKVSSSSCILTGPQILERPEAVPRVPPKPLFITSVGGKLRPSNRRFDHQQFFDRSVVYAVVNSANACEFLHKLLLVHEQVVLPYSPQPPNLIDEHHGRSAIPALLDALLTLKPLLDANLLVISPTGGWGRRAQTNNYRSWTLLEDWGYDFAHDGWTPLAYGDALTAADVFGLSIATNSETAFDNYMYLDHRPPNRTGGQQITDSMSLALDGMRIPHLKHSVISDLAAFHEQVYRFARFRGSFQQFLINVSSFAQSASEEATVQYATEYAKDVFTGEIDRLRPNSGAKMLKTTFVRIVSSLGGAAIAGALSGFANPSAIVAGAVGGASVDLLLNAAQSRRAESHNKLAIQHYTLLTKANYREFATRMHRYQSPT